MRELAAVALIMFLLSGCDQARMTPLVSESASLRTHLAAEGRGTTAPRTWLIAPRDFPGQPDETAPEFDLSAENLSTAFDKVTAAVPDTETAGRGRATVCLITTTPLMRFRDDVCAEFIALGDARSTLALFSASRFGYYDFKTNRNRLHRWLDDLRAEVARRPK